ncbi:MAG: HAD hydrolase-like protein [Planctomycetota bacterium]|nr:HAD hydrolase-like protein [Planctomycetota bacterium]
MFDLTPEHDFLVGIDSDGCVFDTMEVKHKECFIPNIINSYELQGISKYAREAAEFVNLYSKSRGINRFPALIEALEWLQKRPEVAARGIEIKIPPGLVKWLKEETRLGNPALKSAVEKSGDPDLKQAYAWSVAVNDSVEKIVRGVPPFPYVREALSKLHGKADMIVCSATPNEALKREWEEHKVDHFVREICGQEVGTKKEILQVGKKYPAGHVLMIGDAPGDHKAAVANDALFFPINPGSEDSSWKNLLDEGIDRFLNGTFAGDYQKKLLAEFDKCLPALPPWPVR